jgi:hypothetical protein
MLGGNANGMLDAEKKLMFSSRANGEGSGEGGWRFSVASVNLVGIARNEGMLYL